MKQFNGSWEDLVTIEPELESLRSEAASVPLYTCGVKWYNARDGIKERLRKLVGHYARRPSLRTVSAYQIATEKIYNALPDCDRHCVSCGAPVPADQSFIAQKRADSGLAILQAANDYETYTTQATVGPHNSISVVLDVLGFTDLIRSSADEGSGSWSFKQYREALDRSACYLKSYGSDWSIKVFSDNILIGCPVYDDGESELSELFSAVCEFQMSMALNGHFLRGGISLGPLYMDSQMVFGKALIDAHDAELRASSPRVLLSRETIRCLSFYCEYMKGEGAPAARLSSFSLLSDSDGEWFLDYLGHVAAYGDPPSVDSAALLAHREAIVSQLKRHRGQLAVAKKYQWVAMYHNFVCNRAGREDLIIPNVLAAPVFRALGKSDLDSAQEEFGMRFGDEGLSPRTIILLANRALSSGRMISEVDPL